MQIELQPEAHRLRGLSWIRSEVTTRIAQSDTHLAIEHSGMAGETVGMHNLDPGGSEELIEVLGKTLVGTLASGWLPGGGSHRKHGTIGRGGDSTIDVGLVNQSPVTVCSVTRSLT